MNWKQAWGVLRNGLPEPEKADPGPPTEIYVRGEPVELYAVMKYRTSEHCWGGTWEVVGYHHTCEKAFAEAGAGNRVDKVRAFRDGSSYYKAAIVEPITVTPKPKAAKGRK